MTEAGVKIGFVFPDIAGVGAGFAIGLPDEATFKRAFQALVDDANKSGGVHGRKISFATAKQDPLSNDSQRAACIAMTRDEKVFSVIEGGSTIGVNSFCYAEQRVPLFYGSPQTTSAELFTRAGGYNISSGSTGTRVLQNWAYFAQKDGFIGPDKGTLGLVTSECAPDPDMHDKVFKPLLRKMGVKFIETRLSCDVATAQVQIPNALVQLRQGKVDRVLMAVLFVTAQNFLQQAEAQGYRPKYTCSDMWGQCLTGFSENYPAAQWHGTRGYTHYWTGAKQAGKPIGQEIVRCSKIYEAAGLPRIDDPAEHSSIVTYCAQFTTWLDAARASPVNLTRGDLIAGVQRLGEYPNAWAQRTVFRPGKFDGGDSYSVVEWTSDCRCFVQVADFRDAKY